MTGPGWVSEHFEQTRPHLQAVAYSMLGSLTEAEDAVQECWLRLDRSDPTAINDLRSWLTTVTARICLDLLRARKSRREDYVGAWLPESVIEEPLSEGPEQQALQADAIGVALLVVLDTLTPAERLAFVLHDVFDVSFNEIAPIVDRSPTAARQLASRARRQVRNGPKPGSDAGVQRRLVQAFLAAAREGDFDALLEVLDPDVVLRLDVGGGIARTQRPVVGAPAVARHVLVTAPRYISTARLVLINGRAGLFFGTPDEPISILGFTVAQGRIAALEMVADSDKLRRFRIEL